MENINRIIISADTEKSADIFVYENHAIVARFKTG